MRKKTSKIVETVEFDCVNSLITFPNEGKTGSIFGYGFTTKSEDIVLPLQNLFSSNRRRNQSSASSDGWERPSGRFAKVRLCQQ